MRILVIGGSGFLGTQICNRMHEESNQIWSYSRGESKSIHEGVVQIKGSLADTKNLATIIRKINPDSVVQSAWITDSANYRVSSKNHFYERWTKKVYLLSQELRIPFFIGIGSSAEHEVIHKKTVGSEDAYAVAKFRTCQYLLRNSANGLTKTSWLRIFQPYGSGQSSSRLVPKTISQLRNNEKIDLRYPNSIRDWISSIDIARSVSWTLEKELTGCFDVGTGIGTSNRNLIELIARIMGKEPQYTDYLTSLHSADSLIATSESQLFVSGWMPSLTLENGLRDLVRNQGLESDK